MKGGTDKQKQQENALLMSPGRFPREFQMALPPAASLATAKSAMTPTIAKKASTLYLPNLLSNDSRSHGGSGSCIRRDSAAAFRWSRSRA